MASDEVEPGDDGWRTVVGPPFGADGVHVRVAEDAAGERLIITDLYLHGPHLTNETLRGLSMSRMEAGLNGPGERPSEWSSDDSVTVVDLRKRGRDNNHPGRRSERRWKTARGMLTRPDGIDPDAFYSAVARTYSEYAADTKAPARAMAEEADVPVTTVHRWIREARRRGFLPPGHKGRAG